MNILQLKQGTPEWHAHRAKYFNASEAAAMLGISPYQTRDELLRERKAGIKPEVSEHQRRIFDRGHAIEAAARLWAEALIGAELFPCVGVLEGTKLSASFDGLTMDESAVWECKSVNQTLRQIFQQEGASGADLPLHYRAQLEQQLLVSGAKKALFSAAAIDSNGEITECRNCWYTSDEALRQRIINGWQQFEKDLAAYEVKAEAAPLVGKIQDNLPALAIKAEGKLLASNLEAFKQAAMAALTLMDLKLETDQDFADAESGIKFCKTLEARLAKASEQLSMGAGISDALAVIDSLKEYSKCTRLRLDKSVKAEKENRKAALIAAASQRVINHIKALNEGLAEDYPVEIPLSVTSELTAAIKGLKTLSSMQNALDSVVLNYQSEANAESQRKQQQAQAAALEAENAPPPVSSSEAELAHRLHGADEKLALLNQSLYPIQIINAGLVHGLADALSASDSPAVKTALFAHIEKGLSHV